MPFFRVRKSENGIVPAIEWDWSAKKDKVLDTIFGSVIYETPIEDSTAVSYTASELLDAYNKGKLDVVDGAYILHTKRSRNSLYMRLQRIIETSEYEGEKEAARTVLKRITKC